MPRVCIAGRPALVVLCLLAALVLSLPGVVSAAAQTPSRHEDIKLVADDGISGDSFGISVAIDGTTALVGAVRYDGEGGIAYLFDTLTGQQLAQLAASDSAQSDRFGSSTALHGNVALIGDPRRGGPSSSAYLFDISTGQQLAKLLPADRLLGLESGTTTYFGDSLALDGNLALIGAKSSDRDKGAYVFDLTDPAHPVEIAEINSKLSGASFGSDVALDGNLALIGSQGEDSFDFNAGSAYLYDLSDPANPVELAKLTASDPGRSDRFGTSVAIDGNVAIIGTDSASDVGSAYVFDITDPTRPIEVAKLTASDADTVPRLVDLFGSNVAINGNTIIIGNPGDNNGGSDDDQSGSAYLFDATDLNNIVEIAKLTASDPLPTARFDKFGRSVAIAGSTVIVGSLGDKAYVFTVPEPAAAALLLTLVFSALLRRNTQRA